MSEKSNKSLVEEAADLTRTKDAPIYDNVFEDEEEEENLLIPLPTVSDLKLKKYVAKRILDKAKSPLKRTYLHSKNAEKKSKSENKQLEIENFQLEIVEKNLITNAHQPSLLKTLESVKHLQKAIIYPDEKKVIECQAKAKLKENEQISYNEVFTKSVVKKQIAVSAGIESEKKKNNINESQKEDNERSEPFNYKIPQNLISSIDDKFVTFSSKPSNTSQQNTNHETVKNISEKLYCDVKSRKRKFENVEVEQHQQNERDNFQMPSRPAANTDLIDLLAEYRAISLYLLKKLNIDPINFNANDDYINTYKLSRK